MKAPDTRLPYAIRTIPLSDPLGVREDPAFWVFLQGLEGELGASGRIIVRFSGIGPENRFFAEAENEQLCEDVITKIEAYLRQRGYLLE